MLKAILDFTENYENIYDCETNRHAKQIVAF